MSATLHLNTSLSRLFSAASLFSFSVFLVIWCHNKYSVAIVTFLKVSGTHNTDYVREGGPFKIPGHQVLCNSILFYGV